MGRSAPIAPHLRQNLPQLAPITLRPSPLRPSLVLGYFVIRPSFVLGYFVLRHSFRAWVFRHPSFFPTQKKGHGTSFRRHTMTSILKRDHQLAIPPSRSLVLVLSAVRRRPLEPILADFQRGPTRNEKRAGPRCGPARSRLSLTTPRILPNTLGQPGKWY